MIRINLLPWREARRKAHNLKFYILMGIRIRNRRSIRFLTCQSMRQTSVSRPHSSKNHTFWLFSTISATLSYTGLTRFNAPALAYMWPE